MEKRACAERTGIVGTMKAKAKDYLREKHQYFFVPSQDQSILKDLNSHQESSADDKELL